MDLPVPPNTKEPIRASWARQLLACLRSMRLRVGPGLQMHTDDMGTSISLVVPPARAARPRPFACRLARDTSEGAEDGALALYCYLPPETAQAVRFRGAVVATGQVLGTAENPWVRVADGDAAALYLSLAFEAFQRDDGETDHRATGWTLATEATPSETLWPHLVWALEEGGGAVQHHLGSLSLGDPSAGDLDEPDDDTPICGHPLNGTGGDDDDANPLDSPAHTGSGDGAVGSTGHPLDDEGDGGFTPTCKDDPSFNATTTSTTNF